MFELTPSLTGPILIRGLRKPILPQRWGPLEDTDYACWEVLAQAFDCIHRKSASHLVFEQLYRAAYKLILRKKGQFLLHRLVQFETTWLRSTVSSSFGSLAAKVLGAVDVPVVDTSPAAFLERKAVSEEFLIRFKNLWADYCLSISMISDVCMYLVSAGHSSSIFSPRTAYFMYLC